MERPSPLRFSLHVQYLLGNPTGNQSVDHLLLVVFLRSGNQKRILTKARTLAEAMSCSERTVQRSIAGAVKLGRLKTELAMNSGGCAGLWLELILPDSTP